MKITCANPECGKTVHTMSVKLGLPGSGLKKGDQWFCSQVCYNSFMADHFIEDKRCGLRRSIHRMQLGLLLVKNSFITKEQLALALEEGSRSRKRLGEVLIQSGHITEKELKAVLSMQAGVAPITLDSQSKVKLIKEVPFKMINEFQFVIFDFDLESKTILIAIYEMDYIVCLQEYFSKIFPGYLVKFFLEEKEQVLKILKRNFPGKQMRGDALETLAASKEGIRDTELDKAVMRFMEFLSGFSDNEVKIDNLDNAVWLKSETGDFKVDIYLTRKTRGKE
jgi:hypothetical protein